MGPGATSLSAWHKPFIAAPPYPAPPQWRVPGFGRSAMSHASSEAVNGFWPPRCPNPACHLSAASDRGGFFRHGYYSSQAREHRIPRFLCRSCRTTMSSQTFDSTYRLRRPELDDAIEREVARGTSLRGVARTLGINRKTVTRRLRRSIMMKSFEPATKKTGAVREHRVAEGSPSTRAASSSQTDGVSGGSSTTRPARAAQAGRVSEVSISRMRS